MTSSQEPRPRIAVVAVFVTLAVVLAMVALAAMR